MTYKTADMTLWKRKRLKEQSDMNTGTFWGQQVRSLAEHTGAPDTTSSLRPLAFIGFASDEGVRRSAGKTGAAHGPLMIRRALASLAWHHRRAIFDAGDVWCEEQQLIIAQSQLAGHLAHLLDLGVQPVVLGGSREVSWAGYQGVSRHVFSRQRDAAIGVISLGARLLMAEADPQPTALSAFFQIAQYCRERQQDFPCLYLGVDEQVTSDQEFDRAREAGVAWRLRDACTPADLAQIESDVARFTASLDYIYLSVSLDLFSVAAAPGVSTASVFGLDATTGVTLLRLVLYEAQRAEVPVIMADIADCNPLEDPDGRTARLAAGLVYEIARF